VKLRRYDAGRSRQPDTFAKEVETADIAERFKAIFFGPNPPLEARTGARTCQGGPARSQVAVVVCGAGRASFVGIGL
jgi:hypothetical protein